MRIAIIGGGPSGLAAAFGIEQRESGHDVTLYEAAGRVGGLIETVRQDGFLIERGADSFITTKPAGVRLCEQLGLEDKLISPNEENRRSLIVCDGAPVRTPDNFHLIVPRSVGSVLNSPLLSIAGKLRFLSEANQPVSDVVEESLARFTTRRFGAEVLERLVQPITAGIYSADPEELSMQASLPQFLAMEQRYGSLIAAGAAQRRAESEAASGARYGLFATFPEGLQFLIDKLEFAVREHCDIRLQSKIDSITQEAGRWRVQGTALEPINDVFDAVVLALPAYTVAKLCGELNLGPISEIKTASSAIVVTGHKASSVKHPLNAFGMVVPFTEHRPVTAVSFASQKFPNRTPAGHVLCRTFIGGPHGRKLLNASDEVLVETAREQLSQLLGVEGDPVTTLVSRYPDASPQYTLGHIDRVQQIESAVQDVAGLELAGASYRGVGIPDAIGSGDSAAARLIEGLISRSTP